MEKISGKRLLELMRGFLETQDQDITIGQFLKRVEMEREKFEELLEEHLEMVLRLPEEMLGWKSVEPEQPGKNY